MIIQLHPSASMIERELITKRINELGYKITEVYTQLGSYLIALGKKPFDIREIGHLRGILDIHIVSEDYQLVSSKWKVGPSQIDIGHGVKIGGRELSIMAGPCSIEGEENIKKTIDHLVKNGITIMRGGVFKPRSSPYSFRGMGIEGLELWYRLAQENGIKIVSEVMQVSQIEEMLPYVDIFQVGARNTQNFNLLDELGKVDKPVMLKRGISGTIDELLHSAEYIFSAGNEKLILCERGIRTYERASRNTLDLNAVPILKEKTHLPVVVDPSHGIGMREHVGQMALAAVMAGADGIIYETHDVPAAAFSDGQQTLDFDQSTMLINQMREVRKLLLSFEMR